VVELASPNPGAVIRHRFTDDVGGVHVGEGPRLTVARDGILEAWAEAPGLATGRPLRTTFEGLDPRPALAATTDGLRPGLTCATYKGAWSALPDFSELTPIARAVTDKVMVPEAAPAEDVGLRLEGFLRVPRRGLYTLWLWSDDGSRLWLGGEEVIDNDGLHGSSAVSRDLVLEAGLHELRVDFFQHLGGVDLRLEWEGPGLPRQKVPAAALWHRP